MKADTRLFGEIDVEDDKIICMEDGMIGFPDLQRFTLIHDEEKGASIMWFQSMDEPQLAFPVMHPDEVSPDYSLIVDEEKIEALGNLSDENVYVLVTVTAAADVKETTVNLKAPIVINTDTLKGCQMIVESDYPIKFKVYDAIKSREKKAGK